MKQWFLIENKTQYNKAVNRYEEVKEAKNGTEDHKEKMLLAFLINNFEEKIKER